MLSVEAQGYPKTESNRLFLIKLHCFLPRERALKRSSKAADLIRTGATAGTKIFDFYPLCIWIYDARDLSQNSLHAHCLYMLSSAGFVGCMKFLEVS